MDNNLYNFGNLLSTLQEQNKPGEIESFLIQICKAVTETEISDLAIDTIILNLFNESAGILNLLNQILYKQEYKKVKLKCFEILYALGNNCVNKIQNYLVDIIKTCAPVIRSSLSAVEKQKSLQVITIVIQKGKFYGNEHDISELYNITLYKCLHMRFDKSSTVQEELLITIGVITRKYPGSISNPDQLGSSLLTQLSKELYSINRSYPIITGCVKALSYYLENFMCENINLKDIYECVKLLADPSDTNRRTAVRESMLLVSTHIVLFAKYLYADLKWWHTTLVGWFNLPLEDKKVAFNVLNNLFREMANILSTQNNTTDHELFKYLIDWFLDYISKNTIDNYQTHFAIRGLGFFSKAFKLHISDQEINKIFVSISQIVEHKYILNDELDSDQIVYLADYLQTLSSIINNLPELNHSHIACLQRVSSLLIKVFPKIKFTQHFLVTDAFIITCFQVLQCKGSIIDSFLENVIYQGIMWTCSHHIAIVAESFKNDNENIITYKTYIPFWKSIVNIINERKYEAFGLTAKIRKIISKKICSELIKTLFLLINKLNLNTKLKNVNEPITDPQQAFEAYQSNDFVIFVNVVDFYQNIFEQMDQDIYKTWINVYIKQVISKSISYPLISGFYKLLASCLKICNVIHYFDETQRESKEDINVCYQSVFIHIQGILWRMKQYKGDLQIACLHVVLSLPIVFVQELLPYLSPAFISLFDIGRSYLELASLGIDTLEEWIKILPQKDMEPFLKQILPSFDSYLRSRSLGGSVISDLKLKSRKTKFNMKRRKVLLQTEPELLKLQTKIILFIGQLNSDLCMAFVNSGDNVESVIWGRNLYLKVALPYNTKLNIHFDKFTPIIIQLAMYSSDRKIRLAACELFHALILLIVGKCHPMEPSQLAELDNLIKAISKPILKLGCDVDEVVQQLFAPLAVQLMHYYSHPRQGTSSHMHIVVDSLIDAITNASDSSLRDFAGSCIKEYVTWVIKQTDKNDLLKNPKTIKVWIRTIQNFSLHPDPFKRLGAALIFNNTYSILREETHMFNMFWLELLYAFVTNLSIVQENSTDDNNCIDQVMQALSHIQRGFVEKPQLFNKPDKTRRKPNQFDGILLHDVAMWLLKQTGAMNSFCREKCMSIFCAIAPLVKNCNTLQKFNEVWLSKNPEWITETYEYELIKAPTLQDIKNSKGTNECFNWLNGLLCSLDGYIFVLENKLMNYGSFLKNSKFLESLLYFLQNAHLQNLQDFINLIPSNNNCVFSANEKENFNTLKSKIVDKLMQFTIVILENNISLLYGSSTCPLWSANFWNLICNRIFNPSLLRYSVIDYDDKIITLLNNLNSVLPEEILTTLINYMSSYLMDNFKMYTNVGLEPVAYKQRQLLKGLILIKKSPIAEKLNISLYSLDAIKIISNSILESRENVDIINKMHHTVYQYYDLLLQLSNNQKEGLLELTNCLCDSKGVWSEDLQQNTQFGLYFFNKFKVTIINYIIEHYAEFLDVISNHNLIEPAITYILEVLRYIHHNYRNINQNVSQEIVNLSLTFWNNLTDLFDKNINNTMLGLEYIDKLSSITTEPLSNLVRDNGDIVIWIIQLLHLQEASWSVEACLNFKSEVVAVLSHVIGHCDTHEIQFRNALQLLKENYFDQQTENKVLLVTTFEKLLIALKLSKSKLLLTYTSTIYVNTSFIAKEVNMDNVLKSFIKFHNIPHQIECLQLIYDNCFDANAFRDSQRYIIAKDVLVPLLKNCYFNAFEQFFIKIVPNLLVILRENTNSTCFNTSVIINKTIAFIINEVLFARIKIENFENNSCAISKSAYPNDPPSEKKLLKSLTRIALNVCKEKYDSLNKEEKEVFRLYQCHTYNALVSIISNTQKDIEFYNLLFIRESNKRDILWHNLIDTEKEYRFEIDFDAVPSMKKVLVNIRTSLNTTRNEDSIAYIESQPLFKSSLNEDITKFDFSHSILRTQPNQTLDRDDNEENKKNLEIELEKLQVNDHECMAIICGLIQHLIDNDISPLPLENEEVFIPKWIRGIENVMMADTTHKNVRIFLAKVIHNCQNVFRPYAKVLTTPMIKVITDGSLGSELNFFVTDLIVMLMQWSTIANPSDRVLASELLKFVMQNIDNDRRNIFKYNLEQAKLILENWKSCVDIPFDLILSKFKLDIKSKRLNVGVHLAGIVLANDLPFWPAEDSKNYLQTLTKILKSEHRNVYQPCAEVVGMALQLMSKDRPSENHLEKFINYLHVVISKEINNDDKFAYCLEGICRHFPSVADKYLERILLKLQHVHGYFKCIYLRILLSRVDTLHSINELSSLNFAQLLMGDNFEAQVLTLEIIEKSIKYTQKENLMNILEEAAKFVNNSFTISRNIMYDIFITAYNFYNGQQNTSDKDILEFCKDILLQGLIDKESVIQEKLLIFWSSENNLPADLEKMFPFLINQMYSITAEEHYIPYSAYLLLNCLKTTREFMENLFDHALYDCDFQEYKLKSNWRRPHASIAPLFADSLSSQSYTLSSINLNVLRATVSTLEFMPTQAVEQTARYQTITRQRSLFATQNLDSTFIKNTNSDDSKKYYTKSKRFIKNDVKIHQYFAHMESKKNFSQEAELKDKVKRSERDIALCRSYRIGEYPDIQITLASIIVPLQVLVRCDDNLARCLYTSLFTSLVTKIQSENVEDDSFTSSINIGIDNIFKRSIQFIPSTMGTFLDIVLTYKNYMQFEPNVIANVCENSGLFSVGCLILEEDIVNSETSYNVSAKRGRGIENDDSINWIKLAELYKAMDEWDIVRAIFLEKINCSNAVISAIEAESTEHWRSAQEYYANVIEEESTLERKDFYYESYFKCLTALAEWNALSNFVEGSAKASNQNNVWNYLWDNDWNQRKLLPWYITAELHNTLKNNKQDLFKSMNEFMIDSEKSDHLKSNYGEELAMLWLLQNDVDTSIFYLNHSMTTYLESWSRLNPLFIKLRANTILNCRNTVDMYLFINSIKNLNALNEEMVFNDLVKLWLDSSNDKMASLLMNETKTVYRNKFFSVLENNLQMYLTKEEMQSKNLHIKNCKFKLYMNLIENALDKGNYYVARTYIKQSARPSSDGIANIQWALALSKTLFLKAKASDNLSEKLLSFMDAGKRLRNQSLTIITDESLCYYIKNKEFIYDLTQEMSKIFLQQDSLLSENREALQGLVGSYEISNAHDVCNFGVQTYVKALDYCGNEINNLMVKDNLNVYSILADSYVKLAYYVQKQKELNPNFILYVLRGMKYGSVEAKQLFPCLLNIDIGVAHKDLFLKESSEISIWMYLDWIPQLLANLDSNCINAIAEIVLNIAKTYPQALIFAYRFSKIKFDFKDQNTKILGMQIIPKLDELLLQDNLIDCFLKSFGYVTLPVNILQYHIKKLKTQIGLKSNIKDDLEKVIDELYPKRINYKNAESMQGEMYKEIKVYESKLRSISKGPTSAYSSELGSLLNNIKQDCKNFKTSQKLSDYSPWLANFQATELHANLEIPGQYNGDKRPLPQYHTKIMGFSPIVSLLKSLRRPIKITILGNNAKEYPYLIKFGEDLRQDQRIEQIFQLMNKILLSDPNCNKRQLSIHTYQVIPLTSQLGIIEWLTQTCVLKSFIENNITDETDKKMYREAAIEYATWIRKASRKSNLSDAELYTNAVLKYSSDNTVNKFKTLINTLSLDILSKSLKTISINSESFFALRHKFAISYAVMCISHWLLGIGDRHLENSLISLKTGEVIGIDFGYAFGISTQILPIPELVPFRLTPHILSLLQPLCEHGLLQETMIHCLRAYRKNREILLATMDVFLKEPSLDWLEFARHSNPTNPEWYPNKKIEHARRKFDGENSTTIMIEEFQAGHNRSTYLEDYVKLIKGNTFCNFRAKKNTNLSVEDQVKCLIDHATDYNLLGRMFVGWQPWV